MSVGTLVSINGQSMTLISGGPSMQMRIMSLTCVSGLLGEITLY